MRLAHHLKLLLHRPLRALERREFTTSGGRVRVHLRWDLDRQEAADDDLPTFVFVHGLGVSSRYFVPVADRLADRGRIVLFDLPGFARLPTPKAPLSIEGFADVVAEALERVDLPGRPVLVGHSMGCQVVAELLATQAVRCHEAMLINPVVNEGERTVRLVLRRFAQAARYESRANALAALTAYARCGLRWVADTMPRMVTYPIERRLAGVDADVVIVRGENDALVPDAWAQLLASAPAQGRVMTLDGAAHGAVFDHAEQIAEELLRLTGLPTEEAAR